VPGANPLLNAEPAELEPAELEPAELEPAEVEPAEVEPAEVENGLESAKPPVEGGSGRLDSLPGPSGPRAWRACIFSLSANRVSSC
jgi:hypothetical protein